MTDIFYKTAKVIAWWSGGITSAVACKLAIEKYSNIELIFIDTKNEDEDTYRFLNDCQVWYNQKIKTVTNEDYSSIQDVWYRWNSLNVANGAICSSELKRIMRIRVQNMLNPDVQIFGFDKSEKKRARNMTLNHPDAKAEFPLIEQKISKAKCIEILSNEGILVPKMYRLGFNNNNCFKTGCVQGGVGYWQKIKKEFPDKFEYMAKVEHELTERKGKPVTMLKNGESLIFLKKNDNYPEISDITTIKGRQPKNLLECNGFCASSGKKVQLELNLVDEFDFIIERVL